MGPERHPEAPGREGGDVVSLLSRLAASVQEDIRQELLRRARASGCSR